jgi:uncharacterized membrane protein
MPREGVVERAVTVNAPRESCTAGGAISRPRRPGGRSWESVEDLSDDRHRWTVRTPGDKRLSYETVVTEERAGEVLAWESAPGAKIAAPIGWSSATRPAGEGPRSTPA